MSRWRFRIVAESGPFTLDVDVHGEATVVAVLGANGSGKTTLLRAIAGAMSLRTAEVEVNGEVLESTSNATRVPIELRRVGYVPQGYGLFSHLSVLDNVGFGLARGPSPPSRAERMVRAQAVLDALGHGELASRRVGSLSGGEAQAVALARALAVQPRLLLLDEPLAALDASSRRGVRARLAEHVARSGCPTVVVTHDVRDVEALADTAVVLERGRVVQQGSLTALRAAPCSAFVEEFVNSGVRRDG
jgi:molybdate transport system ATP-binding protein